jgi:hypothetical protein
VGTRFLCTWQGMVDFKTFFGYLKEIKFTGPSQCISSTANITVPSLPMNPNSSLI